MDAARIQLDALSQRLREAQERWRPQADESVKQEVETAAGTLRRRRLHEWLGVEEAQADNEQSKRRSGTDNGRWTPAMAVLMEAASQAWRDSGGGLVVWIGRAIWPYAVNLCAEVMADSVLIHPPDTERLWTIDLALRSGAVTAVVADGSALSLRATRRLQLAAEAGRSLALLARPAHETQQRSAAAYRWKVRLIGRVRQGSAQTHPIGFTKTNGLTSSVHQASNMVCLHKALTHPTSDCPPPPRWEIELLRGKDATAPQEEVSIANDVPGLMRATGVKWSRDSMRRVVEWRHEGLVTVPAMVVDSAAQAAAHESSAPKLRRGA